MFIAMERGVCRGTPHIIDRTARIDRRPRARNNPLDIPPRKRIFRKTFLVPTIRRQRKETDMQFPRLSNEKAAEDIAKKKSLMWSGPKRTNVPTQKEGA